MVDGVYYLRVLTTFWKHVYTTSTHSSQAAHFTHSSIHSSPIQQAFISSSLQFNTSAAVVQQCIQQHSPNTFISQQAHQTLHRASLYNTPPEGISSSQQVHGQHRWQNGIFAKQTGLGPTTWLRRFYNTQKRLYTQRQQSCNALFRQVSKQASK